MAGTLTSKLPSISPLLRFAATRSLSMPRSSALLRPIISLAEPRRLPFSPSGAAASLRCFSTRPTTSSLNDPSPNWSNRPPKETILLDGCDFEHWLVVVDPPAPELTRDDIIDSYVKKLAEVVGSEEEARMKIYSVSTKHYFAFGALVSEELSYKIKTLANVRWVLPDSYLDVRNKDYGGEPFIDGKAVPYDPKYHEEWVRNNARANERSRRNDRPRNNDRSRNFDRRRENMQYNQPPAQNQTFQGSNGPPMPPSNSQNSVPPQDMPRQPPPPMSNSSSVQNPISSPPPPNRDFPSPPPSYQGGRGYAQNQMPPNPQGGSMPNGSGYQGNGQGYPVNNYGGGAPNGAGYQSNGNQGYQGGAPGYQNGGGSSGYQPAGVNYQGGGGPGGYQHGAPNNYNNYQGGGGPAGGYQGGSGPAGGYQGGGGPAGGHQAGASAYQGRDMPGRD